MKTRKLIWLAQYNYNNQIFKLGIDPIDLLEQRSVLNNLIEGLKRGKEKQAMIGIQNLLDAIQDYCEVTK